MLNDESTAPEPSGDADIEDVLRELSDNDTRLVAPPTELWNRIEREAKGAAAHPNNPIDTPTTGAIDFPNGAISLDQRRRPRTALPLAAAAAIVAVVGIGFALKNRDPSPQQIAQAELTYDPAAFDPLGADAAATARLLDNDGTLTIGIDESSLPTAADADLEVWLIEPDNEGDPVDLVSLGTIDPDHPSELTVPASLDPDVYYVVDISIEPHDGDPSHSGRSILRGSLTSI